MALQVNAGVRWPHASHKTGRMTMLLGYCASPVLCFLAASIIACSSQPGPRTGALAPAADSVANAVQRLECNGPYACFGSRGDTIQYFETARDSGVVQFVAYEVPRSRANLVAGFDSLTAQFTALQGKATSCPQTDRSAYFEERQWGSSGSQLVLFAVDGAPKVSQPFLQIVRRVAPKPCGERESPALFR
jgi:hypothetical protein